MAKSVSLSVVRRLPRYHRFLKELMAEGVVRISSGDLSRRMGPVSYTHLTLPTKA